MPTIEQKTFPGDTLRKASALALGLALLGALFWIGREGPSQPEKYRLFHILAEMFRISVAIAIFMIAWNTRWYAQSGFVLTMGVGLLFVAVIDLTHTIAYQGMGVLDTPQGANLASQLWMAGRFLEAPTLVLAMLLPWRKINPGVLLAGFGAAASLLLLSIFVWDVFPDCYREQAGRQTLFKIVGEWVTVVLLGAALVLLSRRGRRFERSVRHWLGASIVGLMVSEVLFTGYVSVFDTTNQSGHIVKLVAFYCAYKALIETGLRRPYDLLFRGLQASRRRLRESRDELERRVEQRTADLSKTVDDLMSEVRERMAAERRLKESQERFRLIAETVRDVFWISTPGMGSMLYVSPAYEEIWGRSRESLYQRPESFFEAVHPDDRKRMIAGRGGRKGGDWDFEYRIIRPDGTVCWVQDRGYPIRDEQGRLQGMAGTASDITARKIHEQDLAESEARLAKAQDIARVGNWEWDIRSNELWWSDQVYRIFGIDREQFTGTYKAFESFVHPEDRPSVEAAVKQALAGVDPYGVDHRIVLRDGTERVVHESGEVVRDAEGRPLLMSGTIQDITERKQVEAQLQESEQRYRELVELSPLGIVVSVEGRVVFANPAAVSIFGVASPRELTGTRLADLVRSEDVMVFTDRLRCAQEMRAEMPLMEMRMTKADGTPLSIESASAFVMHDRKPAVQTVFRDVTERKRQEALIEQERRRLYAVLDMLPAYVSIVGPDYRIRFANHRYVQAFGEPGENGCYRVQCGRRGPCQHCRLPRLFAEGIELEYEWSTPQGRTFRTWAYPFADIDGAKTALVIGVDVTERRALEKLVIDASEIERRGIGRDLHDSLGQELTGLSLLTESLVRDLGDSLPDKAALGRQILKLVRYSVSQVRAMSKGLDPVSLAGGGLVSGLREMAQNVQKQSGIECTVACGESVAVEDEATATHLYRIAQEAVHNAVKHAEADHIEITLEGQSESIRLTVRDDGRGLVDHGPQSNNGGMGMRTMRYRANVLKGTLDISAGEHGGTRVTCRIPAARGQG